MPRAALKPSQLLARSVLLLPRLGQLQLPALVTELIAAGRCFGLNGQLDSGRKAVSRGAMPRHSKSKQQKDEELMTLTLPHADAQYANPDISLGQEFPTRFSHLISMAHALLQRPMPGGWFVLVHSGTG